MDDLAATVTGLPHAEATELALVRLSTAIGLRVESHTCTWLEVEDFDRRALRGMAGLPWRLEARRGGYAFTGAPP
eukprot:10878486-Prorocentrum_lima.AAC.1